MSNVQVRLNDAVDLFEADGALVNTYVHGSNTTTLETDSGTVSSIAKLQKDVEDTVTNEIAAVTQAKEDAETARDEAVAASGGVYVSENDTTSGVLFEKITVSGNASITVTNEGGNEKFNINVPAPNIPSKASQAEAEAGADDSTYMTPLKTSQAIEALSSGGAWELVSDVTISGSPTALDITSGFDGDYIHVIYLYDLKFTSSGNMLTRLTNDGGSTFDSASNYSRSLWRQGLTNSSTHGNSQTEFNISDSACNYLSGVITIQNANNASGVTEFRADLHTGTDNTGPQTEGNTSMVIGWHSVYEIHNGLRIFNGSTITNGRYKHYKIKV